MGVEIAIASCILQGCKLFCDLCYPELKDLIKFKEDKERLSCHIELLTIQKSRIIEYIEDGKRKGKVATGQVEHALQRIQKVEQDYQKILYDVEAKGSVPQALCCNCNLLLELSQRVKVNGEEMKTVLETIVPYMGGEGVVKDPPPPMVQEFPVPHVYGRQAVIDRIMRFLDDDGIRIIGVWGITGVGKTTVAKMVNNHSGKQMYVFYVTVKDEPDIKGIQDQIARRLEMNLGKDDSEDARASALFGRLKLISFLLILDDVHDKLDLDVVGVPNRSDQSTKSKVLLTTTNFEVCKTMSSDQTVEVEPLPEAEAWSLFREKAGKVVKSHEIQQLAQEGAKGCEGVPLFLVRLGEIMRGCTATQ